MLKVVSPVALVFSSVGVGISPIAIGLVVNPVAIIYIAVCVKELSFPVCFIEFPLSCVPSTVLPYLGARPLSLAFLHVTSIYRTILELEFIFKL